MDGWLNRNSSNVLYSKSLKSNIDVSLKTAHRCVLPKSINFAS